MEVKESMKIAMVAPLFESVPPKLYGGTERVVSYLTEELVQQGHRVTLFASGDSITRAKLVPVVPQGLRLAQSADPLAAHMLSLAEVVSAAKEFDVIHFHIDYLHFPISRSLRLPQLSTLHGRLDLPDLVPLYRAFTDMPLISVSNEQRKPLSFASWLATVYHGLPQNLYDFHPGPGNYLAFIGRFSPEKRVDRAIEIAKRVGIELRIAAKLERTDEPYYQQVIEPLLGHPLVNYVGEIGEHEKAAFLGGARALLFPIDWPEPFGLAMIEAMACGTPIVAFRRGSVPEVVTDGETGYVVDSIDDAARVVERIDDIDRRRCRSTFEKCFTARRMTHDYLSAYHRIASKESSCRVA